MADKKISALTGATTPLAGTEVLPIVQSGSTVKVAVSDLTAGRAVSASSVATTGNITSSTGTIQATTGAVKGVNITGMSTGTTYFVDSGYGTGMVINGATATAPNTINLYNGAVGGVLTMTATGDVNLIQGNLVQGTAAKGVNFTANTPAAGMTSQLLNWYEEGTFTPSLLFGGANVGMTGAFLGTYTRVGRLVTFAVNLGPTLLGSSTGNATVSGLPFTSAAYPNPSLSLFVQYDGQTVNVFALIAAGNSTLSLINTLTGASLTQANFTGGTSFIRISGTYTV